MEVEVEELAVMAAAAAMIAILDTEGAIVFVFLLLVLWLLGATEPEDEYNKRAT
jgi:hypothetical protein